MSKIKITAAELRYISNLRKLKPAHRAAVIAAVRQLLTAEARTKAIPPK